MKYVIPTAEVSPIVSAFFAGSTLPHTTNPALAETSVEVIYLTQILHHLEIFTASILRQGVKRVYKKSITYLSLVLCLFEILSSGSILRQGVKKV